MDGEHDPVTELVINAFLALAEHPCLFQLCQLLVIGAKLLDQYVPTGGRITDFKIPANFTRQATAFQVFNCLGVILQLLSVEL